MPRDKDLKRLIRARMQKTGEAYTTARAHITRDNTPPEAPDAVPPSAAAAAHGSHAELAGRSDALMLEKTGREWAGWLAVLDAVDATALTHTEIARRVREDYGVDAWWAQTVTVGYERIRGLRETGQRRGGGFEVNRSRTFPVPLAQLFTAWSDEQARSRWLGGVEHVVRTENAPKSMRLGFSDGTIVVIGFVAKGEGRSTVTVTHTKLPDRSASDRMKEFWKERLDHLGEMLGTLIPQDRTPDNL